MKKWFSYLLCLIGCLLLMEAFYTLKTGKTFIPVSVSQEEAVNHPVIALTFDDGPHSIYTKRLLDGLRERDVKATFFLIGCNITGKEDLIRQMQADGHLIGSHTCRHVKLTDLSEKASLEEIETCNDMIEAITGEKVRYIRPPYGSWNPKWSDDLDMRVVLWDVDPEDWKVQNTKQIVNHILKEVADQDVILLHDIFQSSVDAALEVVDLLLEEGYEFARVDELYLD